MMTDENGRLKNVPWLSMTTKSTYLQMPTLSRFKFNSHLPRWGFLCLPGRPLRLSRWSSSEPSTLRYQSSARQSSHSTACETHSECVEYPSNAACASHPNASGGIHINALTRSTTKVPAGSHTHLVSSLPYFESWSLGRHQAQSYAFETI